jgi:outer membrane protein assembly factor BamB
MRNRRYSGGAAPSIGALVVLASALALWTVRPGAAQVILARSGGRPDEAKPIPLINADEEMGTFVKKASELMAKADYVGAIDILQALLNRPEQCFVPTEDPRRYVPLAAQVNQVIGQMPPEGLQLYRRQFDPQAERLFRAAEQAQDEGELRDLVRRFFHSSYGEQALNRLGAMLFDRGEFSQAALCWRDILRNCRESRLDRSTLLAKIAVGHHFAGERARAEEAAGEVRQQYPSAKAVLGGKDQGVAAFVDRVLATPPPLPAPALAVQEGWPSLAGAPDSVAIMGPCVPVLSPRWSTLSGRLEDNPNIRSLLAAATGSSGPYGDPSGSKPPQVVLKEGQVTFVYQPPGQKVQQGGPVPCFIHPVVAGHTVLYRGAEGVAAHDLLTGEKLWETFAFPLYRALPASGARTYYGYNPYGLMVQDQGRCALTLAEGKVFAVGKFLPPNVQQYFAMAGLPQARQLPDTSVLEAFSLSSEGRRLWRLGDGEGPADLVRAGKFLSPPTYAGGRLFVLVQYIQAFHLLCLEAENARLVWSVMVSQMPVPANTYQPYARGGQDQGSPPAVADGRVFAVTNAGVIAAFEADSGRALWAYQYESPTDSSGLVSRKPRQSGQVGSGFPPNPVVVAKGRVIVLPSDSRTLAAFRTDTGELLWSVDRREQLNLTALDESRLLLSEDGLLVVDAATGKDLWPTPETRERIATVVGRPAVTSDSVLASGRGELIRLSLNDYALERLNLVEPEGILGNLVSVAGKLVAANAAGVSAYSTFEEARDELTQRLNGTGGEDAALLYYHRGMNAFNAKKPDLALPDLLKAEELARQGEAATVLARTGQALYRTYTALADRAPDDGSMLELFKKAEAFAASPTNRGEMLIRLMKYYRKLNQPVRSAELAQKLTADFADVNLAGVEIGPSADPYVRDDPYTTRRNGYELGHEFIKDLIDSSGQDCYAAFDAQADGELKAAQAADDPQAMIKVTDRYPHSLWAPMALLRASESLYRQGATASGADQRDRLSQAGLSLGRINRQYPDSGLAASARLGRAMIYQRLNHPAMVERNLRALEALPSETRLAFADLSGPREEVVKGFSQSRRPRPTAMALAPEALVLPLAKLYAGEGPAMILRDDEGQPLRAAGAVFILQGEQLTLLDASADTYADATKWQARLPIDVNRMYQYGYSGRAFSLAGCLSADGGVVAVCTRGGFAGVEVRTGKVLWQKPAADPAVSGMFALATSAGQIAAVPNTGAVQVFDAASGQEVWKHAIPQQQLALRGPPQFGGGLLLVPHGRTEPMATVFDLATRRALGSIRLTTSNVTQFDLTGDGLVLASDGRTLRLVEPVLGIDQPIWTLNLAANLQPCLLAATDAYAVLSPNINSSVVEVRSLDDEGGVRRTFQASAVSGRSAMPFSAMIGGERLFVLGGSQPNYSRQNVLSARGVIQIQEPSLHAFDLVTGKTLWQADLSTGGGQPLLVQVGQTRQHLVVVAKENAITRPARLLIIDAQTGKVAQKIELPTVQNLPQPAGYFQHMAMSAPAAAGGRLVVETLKGIEVYGTKEAPGDAPK